MTEDDPFEELERDVGDRDGDPFETLGVDEDEPKPPEQTEHDGSTPPEKPGHGGLPGETEHDESTAPKNQGEDGRPTLDPQSGSGSRPEESTEPHPPESRDTVESPSGLGDGPRAGDDPFGTTTDREGDPFTDLDEVFEEVEVGEVDPDAVWEALEAGGSVTESTEKGGREYADVSKHSYCEQCEHFSEPPDAYCTHEGTEIVEFRDMETVRVVDCPIVAERAELEAGSGMPGSGKD